MIRQLEDMPSPKKVMAALRREPGAAFLDSSSQGYGLGRYSIFACNPSKTFSFEKGNIRIVESGGTILLEGDCFEQLRKFADIRSEYSESTLPFLGGMIGYFSYDLGWELEDLPERICVDYPLPQACFGWYDAALIYDHLNGVFFGVSIRGEENLNALLEKARQPLSADESFSVSGLRSNFDRSDFVDAVEEIRSHILNGEIYQANLAQRFEVDFSGSIWALYERLRETNPAPYSAYLKFGEENFLSSSPERFLMSRNQMATTRPIKGTRPRGVDAMADLAFERALSESKKDRAELLMIVDLERNDLGKVCEPGSIQVSDLFAVERYSRVIHQTANVSGRLEQGKDAFDCLEALFPGGSITGAPKIRSMEVIEELERHRRGIYTGSIGYVSSDGNADFNIAIRTMRQTKDKLLFHVGSGIVWDSDPNIEYEETLHKAIALLEALGMEDAIT